MVINNIFKPRTNPEKWSDSQQEGYSGRLFLTILTKMYPERKASYIRKKRANNLFEDLNYYMNYKYYAKIRPLFYRSIKFYIIESTQVFYN